MRFLPVTKLRKQEQVYQNQGTFEIQPVSCRIVAIVVVMVVVVVVVIVVVILKRCSWERLMQTDGATGVWGVPGQVRMGKPARANESWAWLAPQVSIFLPPRYYWLEPIGPRLCTV